MGSLIRNLAPLLAALYLGGCATFRQQETPTITFHVDRRFSPDERTCIQDAADQWEEQTDGLVRFVTKYDALSNKDGDITGADLLKDNIVRWNSGLTQVLEADSRLQINLGEPGTSILGNCEQNVYDNVGGIRLPITIHVVSDRIHDQNLCKGVVMHELGHSLGLDHQEGWPGNVMFHASSQDKNACLKSQDLAEYCRLHGEADCMTHMHPCTPTVNEVSIWGQEPPL